ncbi:MAG: hypothetical protein V7618_11595 [Rhodoglobus sp.]
MDKKDEAREAIYTAIAHVATAAQNYGGTTGSTMARDAAIAWRAVAGGVQPGSIVVESK